MVGRCYNDTTVCSKTMRAGNSWHFLNGVVKWWRLNKRPSQCGLINIELIQMRFSVYAEHWWHKSVSQCTPSHIGRTKGFITKLFAFGSQHYIIKNKQLVTELNSKLKRILSFEQSKLRKTGKHYFRQNIFGVYNKLVDENSWKMTFSRDTISIRAVITLSFFIILFIICKFLVLYIYGGYLCPVCHICNNHLL